MFGVKKKVPSVKTMSEGNSTMIIVVIMIAGCGAMCCSAAAGLGYWYTQDPTLGGLLDPAPGEDPEAGLDLAGLAGEVPPGGAGTATGTAPGGTASNTSGGAPGASGPVSAPFYLMKNYCAATGGNNKYLTTSVPVVRFPSLPFYQVVHGCKTPVALVMSQVKIKEGLTTVNIRAANNTRMYLTFVPEKTGDAYYLVFVPRITSGAEGIASQAWMMGPAPAVEGETPPTSGKLMKILNLLAAVQKRTSPYHWYSPAKCDARGTSKLKFVDPKNYGLSKSDRWVMVSKAAFDGSKDPSVCSA